jgi:hypothetical protein
MAAKKKTIRGGHRRAFDPIKAASFQRNLSACLDRLGMTLDDLRPHLSRRVFDTLRGPKNHLKGETSAVLEKVLRIYNANDLFRREVPGLLVHPETGESAPSPQEFQPIEPPAISTDIELGIMLSSILRAGSAVQIQAVRSVIESIFRSL